SAWRTRHVSQRHVLPHPRHQRALDHRQPRDSRMHPHGQRGRHRPLRPRQGRHQGRGDARCRASRRGRVQPVPLIPASPAEIALFVTAVTSAWWRPPYLPYPRRAGRLSDSPNPRAVLTYAEPGTYPAPERGFLFWGASLEYELGRGGGGNSGRGAGRCGCVRISAHYRWGFILLLASCNGPSCVRLVPTPAHQRRGGDNVLTSL